MIHSGDAKPFLKAYEAFAVPALILFVLGNALACAFPAFPAAQPMIGLPLIVILLGLALVGLSQSEKRIGVRLAFWLIALIAGSLYYQQWHFRPAANDISHLAPREDAEIEGVVQGRPLNHRVILSVRKMDGQPASGRILADLPFSRHEKRRWDARLEAGRELRIAGRLAVPFESPAPGAFNQQSYWWGQGVTAFLKYPDSLHLLGRSDDWPYPLQRMTENLKASIAATFTRALPSPQSEIFGGLVLGDRAFPVDRDTRQAFVDTGLIHVLAASGMNVGIIAGAVYWLMALLKAPYRLRLLIAMTAVAFYSLLTGLPPSIQRATTMLELALFLKLLDRELSGVFLLCLASALLVFRQPDIIAGIGFQFSVLTTLGLLTMLPPLQELCGYYVTRWLSGLILVPTVAQLWILPLSAAYFNQFPLHAVPFNLAALLLVTPLTLLGFVSALLSLVSPPLAVALLGLARPLVDSLLMLAQWGAGMRWAQWTLPSPPAWQIILMYAAFVVWLVLLSRMKTATWPPRLSRRGILAALLPLFILVGGLCVEKFQSDRRTEIDLIPLSAGRTAFLCKPAGSGERLLLLPERLRFGDSRTVADFLRHYQIRYLRLVVLLPDDLPAAGASRIRNGGRFLQKALEATRIERLLGTEPNKMPALANVRQADIFPPDALAIEWANLRWRGTPQAFQLFSGPFCLLEKSASGTDNLPESARCAVRMANGFSIRLISSARLTGNQYYRLSQVGDRLIIQD